RVDRGAALAGFAILTGAAGLSIVVSAILLAVRRGRARRWRAPGGASREVDEYRGWRVQRWDSQDQGQGSGAWPGLVRPREGLTPADLGKVGVPGESTRRSRDE